MHLCCQVARSWCSQVTSLPAMATLCDNQQACMHQCSGIQLTRTTLSNMLLLLHVLLHLTGLIKLFNRNEDMIATVVGHECAHAVARHSSEKLSLGLFIALAVQVGQFCVGLAGRQMQLSLMH